MDDMIYVSNHAIELDQIKGYYATGSIEAITAEKMHSSSMLHIYDTLEQLSFELELRAAIVKASRELYKSKLAFKVFREALCNDLFWDRTEEGGFLLKRNQSPWNAVKDIYAQGSKYGTECATAIIIVYYGALTKIFSESQFNSMFNNIYLMNWKQLDPSLRVRTYHNIYESLPGDCCYFKNPDVDPLTPEWQGENAIDLGDGTYYGHGIGITTGDVMIRELNKHRKNEATQSAFLLDTATRPGFKALASSYFSIRQAHFLYGRYPYLY